MKRFMLNCMLVLLAFIFTACANIEMGFEKDSPFYSPPSKKVEIETTKSNETKVTKNVINQKHDKLSTLDIRKTNNKEENETTFYYEFVEE